MIEGPNEGAFRPQEGKKLRERERRESGQGKGNKKPKTPGEGKQSQI